jgi:hypothetical protein
MDVSIIMVNYNTRNLTATAIGSIIERTKGILYEIILVDNGSMDDSVGYLQNKFGDLVRIIESGSNLGFGKANNLGARLAKGKYLFFLNTDTVLINNAVAILFDFMETRDEVGICGGNLYNEGHQPNHSFGSRIPTVLSELTGPVLVKLLGKSTCSFNHQGNPRAVGYVIGAHMMVRSRLFQAVGGFDPDFFLYYEEVELTCRIRKMGYRVFSVPDAKIIHLEEGSQEEEQGARRHEWFMASMLLFYQKVYGTSSVKWAYYFCQMKNILQVLIKGKKENFLITRRQYRLWRGRVKETDR